MPGKGFRRFWRAFVRAAALWARSTQVLLLLPFLEARRLYRRTAGRAWRRLSPGLARAALWLARALGIQEPPPAAPLDAGPTFPSLRADQFEPGKTHLPPPLTLAFSPEEAALLSIPRRPAPTAPAPTSATWPQRMMRRLRRAAERSHAPAARNSGEDRPISRPEKPVQSAPLVSPSRRIHPF